MSLSSNRIFNRALCRKSYRVNCFVFRFSDLGKHKQRENRSKDAVNKAMSILDQYLLHNSYLVGDCITLADIVAVCNLHTGYAKVR